MEGDCASLRASIIMLKAAFVLCVQMLQSATNRQLWATCFTTLVGRAAAIEVGSPFGRTRKQNFRERWFVLFHLLVAISHDTTFVIIAIMGILYARAEP